LAGDSGRPRGGGPFHPAAKTAGERPVLFTLADGRRESVRKAVVEINDDCNFSCPGCYMLQAGRSNGGDRALGAGEVASILRTVRPLSVDILGGEPLRSEHFRDIVELCVASGVKTRVFSNLSLMDHETASFLLERGVCVTGKLNIGNPEDGGQLRLQARLIGGNAEMVRGMMRGIAVLREIGYRKPLFSLENLLRRQNIHLVSDFYRWCVARDIEPDIELPACSHPGQARRFLERIAPTPDQILQALAELREASRESGGRERFLPPHITAGGCCSLKQEGLYFRREGGGVAMQPCSANRTCLGLLDGHRSVVAALEHPVMVTRRRLDELHRRGEIEGPCGRCEHFVELCRGGCRSTAENLSGPKSSYPLCWMHRPTPAGVR
jgi:radical SAM protein with 4Fe4S-binding SPASM domain